jgi:hypothetical protein
MISGFRQYFHSGQKRGQPKNNGTDDHAHGNMGKRRMERVGKTDTVQETKNNICHGITF